MLAEQQRDELAELLDHPETSVTALGRDSGPVIGSTFDRFLIAAHITLEAKDERAAGAPVELAVAQLDVAAGDLREVRQPAETSDPRLLAEETKSVIASACDWLTDHLRMDAAALRDGGSFDELVIVPNVLPGCFAHHYTPALVDRIATAVEHVAGKLARYPSTYLASTAEELAAHALIDEARSGLEMDDAPPPIVGEELETLLDLAFEDHDVLLLFDARFDGIESGEIAEQMGMANLHVRDWFEPFRPGET